MSRTFGADLRTVRLYQDQLRKAQVFTSDDPFRFVRELEDTRFESRYHSHEGA